MLARSRFERIEECNILLSVLTSKDEDNLHAFYERVDPITHIGKGAIPFKTGISVLRIAISDILCKGD